MAVISMDALVQTNRCRYLSDNMGTLYPPAGPRIINAQNTFLPVLQKLNVNTYFAKCNEQYGIMLSFEVSEGSVFVPSSKSAKEVWALIRRRGKEVATLLRKNLDPDFMVAYGENTNPAQDEIYIFIPLEKAAGVFLGDFEYLNAEIDLIWQMLAHGVEKLEDYV